MITAFFAKGWRCRYFCPLGAFFGLIHKVGFFTLKRDQISCTGCGACNRVCPANLNIKDAPQINHADCISCMNCVSGCPRGSLSITIFGKPIKKQAFTWMVVGIFFAVLAIVIWTPAWQTKPISNIVDEHGTISVENIK